MQRFLHFYTIKIKSWLLNDKSQGGQLCSCSLTQHQMRMPSLMIVGLFLMYPYHHVIPFFVPLCRLENVENVPYPLFSSVC